MYDNAEFTSDQIVKAIAAIKKTKPGYSDMLELYEKIFTAQEDSKKDIIIKDYIISDEILAMKMKEKFPLIEPSEFIINTESAEKLFSILCGVLSEYSPNLSEAFKNILTAFEEKKVDVLKFFAGLFNEQDGFLQKTSDDFKIEIAVIEFLVYNSIKPSLQLFADKISSYLDKENKWGKGYCPVCGSPAVLSSFEKDGKRFLYCSLCWYKWAAERIYCPNCENKDHKSLHYYEFENEEEHRVDVCDKCRKYIKTVDTRKLDRLMYPPLEHISTSHLDIKIKESGYTSGIETG